ncbi:MULTISPECIES: AAA family ATPase [unclassified Brevundimonas]|uniref:AAA family ATPase n=1 Tax=unclassified Brevundimonas TaxID=2622653 RepID=UPI000E9A1878|nr:MULTISPECIES: AAA family ATPase [unclassified Brevundimonas]MCK6105396.1 AAA family ATPase [Brevundimonas sp. EYE_349]HBI19146.1 ATPase [Brevundimonas sp.]
MTGVVLTGGPGSGKTTLLEALAQEGYAVEPEAGRAIIRQERDRGGDALPWRDRALFARKMLDHDVAAHGRSRTSARLTFHDRGVPDVVGYLTLCGLPIPEDMDRAARALRYHRKVFIAPPWAEIFGQDAERRQDFDEAERTFAAMVAVYPSYGYDLVELPKATLVERVAFVLDQLDAGLT